MNPLPFNDGSDGIFGILIAQGVHSDILFEIVVDESKVLAAFHMEALL